MGSSGFRKKKLKRGEGVRTSSEIALPNDRMAAACAKGHGASPGATKLLEEASRVHLVGIGGTGVRGLVPILLARGMKVSGSDVCDDPLAAQYREQGVICSVGHRDENLDPTTDLVLISAAVRDDNPEVVAANKNRIPVIKYAEGLGFLMSQKQGIAVAGTHGKTTTTTLISHILLDSGEDPSFLIGGEYSAYGGSSRAGKGRHFVAEACEFDRSFLNLRPTVAVVTNIEEEHLDYFESLEDIQQAFEGFVSLLPDDGLLVVNAEDDNCGFLLEGRRHTVETFGLLPGRSDWWAEDIVQEGERSTFTVRSRDGSSLRVCLGVPGLHNIRNALAATMACARSGVLFDRIESALGCFTGVRRRFDVLERDPVTVIDDYAHHPTEVEALVHSARSAYPGRRILGVFQPHQHSRLRRLLGRFAVALEGFDEILITDVFRSRDGDEVVRAIDSSALVDAIRRRGKSCRDTPRFDAVIDELDRLVRPGDIVVFMGAGTVTQLARRYAEHVCGSASTASACDVE